MLLAALLDAGAPETVVRGAIDAVLPGVLWRTEEVRRGGLRGRHLLVEPGPTAEPGLNPGRSRPLADLLVAVGRAGLPASIAEGAERVLERLGRAEATVHGVPPSEGEVHELGDDDTLPELVGVVAALQDLDVER